MSNETKNPASYFSKKSIIAIAGGSSVVAIVLGVFLLTPVGLDFSEKTELPGSDISQDIELSPSNPQPPPEMGAGSLEDDTVVAEVNGEEIMLGEVRNIQGVIQAQSGQRMDSATLLDQLVTKSLLLQEAEEREISVTRTEAEDALEQRISQNNLTVEQFQQRLESQGTTYDETLGFYQEQLIIDELLQTEIESTDIEVSEDEAQSFFEANKDAIAGQMGGDVAYEDISEQIKNTIRQQKQQGMITEFVSDLRSEAQIIKYEDRL